MTFGKSSLLPLAGILALSLAGSVAHADSFSFTAAGATGTLVTGTNTVTVTLTSTTANPTSASQEVSGILFNLTGGSLGTPSISSSTGTLINIASGGAVTPAGGSIDHWGTSRTGSTICLETAGTCAQGGKPVDLIIGPGPYTNANPSITGRNPQIQDTATFVLHINGVTSGTSVSNVFFEFGTGPDSSVPAKLNSPVPEPSSLVLFGTGLLSAAGFARRRFLRG